VEKVNKTKKIFRDTKETMEIRSERIRETPSRNKKRKNRLFRRHIPNASQENEINVNNVMIASESCFKSIEWDSAGSLKQYPLNSTQFALSQSIGLMNLTGHIVIIKVILIFIAIYIIIESSCQFPLN
jgi:hypothetical protein